MPNESLTISRAQGGDRDAVAQLWDAHTPTLYGYLVRTLRDPDTAADVLQRTWAQAIEALPRFRSRGAGFRAWVFAIARNECRQHWRRTNRETPLDLGAHDVPAPAGPDRDAAMLVERALARLSNDDRELLTLRYLADLPIADIARVLGASAVAVRVRIHRALRRARTALA